MSRISDMKVLASLADRSRIKPPAGGRKWGDSENHGRDHEIDDLRDCFINGTLSLADFDRLLGLAFSRDQGDEL